MVIAIGTDIVEISRVDDVYQRHGERFARRILCVSEQVEFEKRNRASSFLAKRFAAKEAVAKALQTGIGRGVSFHDIEIGNSSEGVPTVNLSGGALEVMDKLGGRQMHLSLADERKYAVAYAVLSG